jgi:hypothetical protein
VFCIQVLREATVCPAFFPATFNRTDEFSRRTITFLNAGHAEKKTMCDEKEKKDEIVIDIIMHVPMAVQRSWQGTSGTFLSR